MTMTSSPLPGEFVVNMLLMEYVGHGWDLCRATGRESPYSDHEADAALTAAQAILQPQYRGTGMFEAEVNVADDAARWTASSPSSVATRAGRLSPSRRTSAG